MDLGQTFSISTLALSFFFGAFCRSGSRPQHTQIRLLYNLGGSRRWLLRQTTLRLFWARFLCNSWGRRPAQKIADTTFWDKLWSVLGFSINPGTGHAHDALASARTPECGCDTHVSQAITGYHPEMPPHGFWARARRHQSSSHSATVQLCHHLDITLASFYPMSMSLYMFMCV